MFYWLHFLKCDTILSFISPENLIPVYDLTLPLINFDISWFAD